MLDGIIGMNKLKYAKLKELEWLSKNHSDTELDLYIDLASIFSRLYIKNNVSDVLNYSGNPVVAIISGVINIVAHYRKYIYSMGYSNKIYLIFNPSIPIYQASILSYGHKHFDKYSKANADYKALNDIIDKALMGIRDICNHVNDLYFPDTNKIEDYVAVAHLMDVDRKTLVISNYEEYYLLLPYNDITILSTRKNSYIVNRDNVIEKMLESSKFDSKYISYKLLSHIFTIIGIKNREVKAALGFGRVKALRLLERLLDEEMITNDISIKQLLRIISHGVDEDVVADLYARYQMLDVKFATKAITKGQAARIENTCIDMYDRSGLEEINNNVHNEHVIDFISLYKSSVERLSWG